jgi:hypothetical protein
MNTDQKKQYHVNRRELRTSCTTSFPNLYSSVFIRGYRLEDQHE